MIPKPIDPCYGFDDAEIGSHERTMISSLIESSGSRSCSHAGDSFDKAIESFTECIRTCSTRARLLIDQLPG